ncbi:MAG: PD-(D/E)XK nuclease family protein [Nanoarchaeota archaeon]|nr:PD-(D/E)XK nuclease family protein [Nanoarchaeota archaeon]
MKCKYCGSSCIIKKGIRKRKKKTLQQYKCNNCGRYFTDAPMEGRSYRPNVILEAITQYNLGKTLEQAAKSVNSQFGEKIYARIISSWLKDYDAICSYHRIRKDIGKGKSPVFLHRFEHKQVYRFMYHRKKIELFVNKYFSGLAKYLENVAKECPEELFNKGDARGSQIRINKINVKGMKVYKGKNNACGLAKLALSGVKDNKKRHEKIQELMLANDTATIAVEVPVWLKPSEFSGMKLFSGIDSAITGHIDIIQARYGMIYVLDYKSDALHEKPIAQLFFYALALSVRTGIWPRNFRCAWFDENNYYEFNPNLIMLRNEKIKEGDRKKYWLDIKANRYFTSKGFNKIMEKGLLDSLKGKKVK